MSLTRFKRPKLLDKHEAKIVEDFDKMAREEKKEALASKNKVVKKIKSKKK